MAKLDAWITEATAILHAYVAVLLLLPTACEKRTLIPGWLAKGGFCHAHALLP